MVKKGGKAFGLIAIPTTVVVTCSTESGPLVLAVAYADVPLVVGFFLERVH